jgi:hypothetical protein
LRQLPVKKRLASCCARIPRNKPLQRKPATSCAAVEGTEYLCSGDNDKSGWGKRDRSRFSAQAKPRHVSVTRATYQAPARQRLKPMPWFETQPHLWIRPETTPRSGLVPACLARRSVTHATVPKQHWFRHKKSSSERTLPPTARMAWSMN